eukprot:gnl/TRDRNA2_/TRDRNA2_170656_c1_seq1.p1 gnl/TRDRNA2_/TRDRNA2_170656_c1~~gnl/TRDRNA2_/TRDRNA2_170656_c1_seq1.p1  ORF type:complete len:106 (-),score=8.63 gnl/TRDRNA2_/TRDRNA2_170656_c1_seq1:28-345(-)
MIACLHPVSASSLAWSRILVFSTEQSQVTDPCQHATHWRFKVCRMLTTLELLAWPLVSLLPWFFLTRELREAFVCETMHEMHLFLAYRTMPEVELSLFTLRSLCR